MNALIADLLTQARRFSQSGNLDISARKYQQILAREPENPRVHFELGVVAYNQGHQQTAISHLRMAIELDPTQADFHNGLGIAYSSAGDLAAGARCFMDALALDPANAVVYKNLASNYKDQGRLEDAIGCYRQSVAANPKYLEAHLGLGELFWEQGKPAATADVYRKALAANPKSPDLRFRLATMQHCIGSDEEAVTLYDEVVTSHPSYPGLYSNLGLALARLGRFDEAIASYKRAFEIEPNSAAAHNNLGNTLRQVNDLDGALASYRNALSIEPDHATAHSNVLLILNYLPGKSQAELYEAALQFQIQQAGSISEDPPAFRNSRDENRRLRIAYVSPDFRTHSVAHFTRKLIGAHDRDRVEVFCYSNAVREDQITSEFRAQADHWVPIAALTDRDVVDRIRLAQIDILIDLAGHTADNRLLVFAHRPAPVQMTWLGYPNTTGLRAIDYRLTDAIADPPGVDRWYTEQLIRLPHGFLCYQTDDPEPAVTPPPCLQTGQITFGSFNSLAKVTPEVVRIWSRILMATPNARLVLKSRAFGFEKTRSRYLQDFGRHGVSPEQIDLLELIPGRDKHLAAYSKMDIGLDPFPYNGTTTTCEALWMGVPVNCLLGDRHAGRVGASIMHRVGLPELVAESEDGYVERACSLAADTQRLAMLREQLRPKMRESILMDVRSFAQSLETAYRQAWKHWCESHHG